MKLARNLLIFLIICAAVVCACIYASRHYHKNITREITETLHLEPMPTSWVGQYLSGYYAAQTKDYEKASDFFAASMNAKTDNAVLQSQAMSLFLVAGKFSDAVKIAHQMGDATTNGLARLTLIADAVKSNNLAEAEKLTANQPEESTAIVNSVIAAWVKFGQGKGAEAQAMLPPLQKDVVFLPYINYNFALIANLSGDKQKAGELYDSLLESKQLPSSILSSAFAFYTAQNNSEKLGVLKTKFNYDGSVKNHPPIENVQDGVAESLLGVGGIIMTQYSPDKSAALFQLALYLNPKLDDAKLLLGSIFMNEGDYKSANEIFARITKDSYLEDYAKLAIAKNYEAMGEDEKAKDYFTKLTENPQTQVDALVALGDLERKNEKYSEAADYYTKSLDASKGDAAAEKKYWAIYFVRGVCYERLKEMDKSEADLQTALKLEPRQPDVMNYLAFSWIDEGKNLEQAKEMVMQAHEEKPDDPQIIDSVGWAFFKLGNYDYSVEYLEAAASLLPYDPVVNDHLGDAYWQTGRKNEAKFQWERALKNNPEPKLEVELKKKMEQGTDAILNISDATESPR